MKNTTNAANRANKISAARKSLKKWSTKNSDLGVKFTAKYTEMIKNLEAEEKEGLFIVVGKTFPIKDELKKAGFNFCSGSQVWFSENEIGVEIDGIEIIKG